MRRVALFAILFILLSTPCQASVHSQICLPQDEMVRALNALGFVKAEITLPHNRAYWLITYKNYDHQLIIEVGLVVRKMCVVKTGIFFDPPREMKS